jgi:hypothetical protein
MIIRGRILGLDFFVTSCQTAPSTLFDNPKDVKKVAKGTEIRIWTLENKKIIMVYDSVTEDAVIGYVKEIYKPNSYVVEHVDNDEFIDSVPLENIDQIVAHNKVSKLNEIFAPTEGEVKHVGVCIVTLGLICGH